MALIQTSPVASGPTSFAGRIQSALHTLIATFVAWNDARQTRKALSRLSDHELDDIGLTRADIDAVARGTYS